MARDLAKYGAIIGIITVICSIAASYAITRVGVQHNAQMITDHEGRLRVVETCVANELSAIKTDLRWIVNTLDMMQRQAGTGSVGI